MHRHWQYYPPLRRRLRLIFCQFLSKRPKLRWQGALWSGEAAMAASAGASDGEGHFLKLSLGNRISLPELFSGRR